MRMRISYMFLAVVAGQATHAETARGWVFCGQLSFGALVIDYGSGSQHDSVTNGHSSNPLISPCSALDGGSNQPCFTSFEFEGCSE